MKNSDFFHGLWNRLSVRLNKTVVETLGLSIDLQYKQKNKTTTIMILQSNLLLNENKQPLGRVSLSWVVFTGSL